MGAKTKSKRQVRYLLSSVSPLTGGEKARLKNELHTGAVRVAETDRVRARMRKRKGKRK